MPRDPRMVRLDRIARATRQPRALQAMYARRLVRLVVGLMRERLEHVLADVGQDSAALDDIDITRRVRDVEFEVGQVIDGPELREAAAGTARQLELFVSVDQKRLIEAALKAGKLKGMVAELNVFAGNPYLMQARDEFVKRNVGLIKTLSQDTFADIERNVSEGIQSGLRHSQIAQDLQARLGVAESRARLIARDQVLKFNGELASVRQQAAGVTHFTWYSSQDQRVRDSHKAMHGRVFAWSDPPVVDGEKAIPGGPIQCRCNALPFFD